MLGILRGSLVTACCGVVGDFSADAKVKLRRIINEDAPAFCQQKDWAFLHTVASFTMTIGTYSYSGSDVVPLGFQRFITAKVLDSDGDYTPVDEKSLAWYKSLEDPTFGGTPFAVVNRGIDSDGYPVLYFYYNPDEPFVFEGDCTLNWTDVSEAASADTTRIVITADCFSAFKYWVARGYAILQGDDALVNRCDLMLYGNPAQRRHGLLEILLSKQRGAGKVRSVRPDGSYKGGNYVTSSDYGRHVP